MAKPRKSKNEDQKGGGSSSGAVVRHQKLCLSIDVDRRRIYGFTELEIAVPDSGVIGLYVDDLEIESVLVDNEPAKFEVFPHYHLIELENRWCSVSSVTSAADAAGSTYISALDKEMVPNLYIMCCKPDRPASEQHGQLVSENGLQSSEESKQNVKTVRVNYWVEKAETTIRFENSMLVADNQIRHARCWFPCMDEGSQRCCYDLEFTVAHNLVAVSTGSLLYQVLTKEYPSRKTYVYQLNVPVTAQWICLTVAPFEILADRHNSLISHMCLSDDFGKLKNTVGFVHSALSHYEDYLSASFPFGSYKQVFVPPEMTISSCSVGASMSIFSSELLFDEKVIDQTIETRIKLAHALARQWFGVFISPEAPNDDWLLDGLAGFLVDSFVKRFLGNNEARYQRYKANCAVCSADDCGATALSSSSASKELYGTHCIGLYGKIRSWKSVAVLQMLEKQMGPESFRKILQNIVFRAQDTTRSLRTLSTKEFRHFANKVGNLERPFLKEFFPRWVGSCGCPVLRMGLSYNKRKNMIELAVLRGCTAATDSSALSQNGNPDSENRDGDVGWPGMMSIRVHELDGMYDHPILPVAGDPWQLLEIQCHSKLAARRFQKPKKAARPDGFDDNVDVATVGDTRPNTESPLLWLRADPEMEYLAEIHFNQPVQMWINQLEKDKDVVAQAQAIETLKSLPQRSFSVVNALYNFLSDSKAFWRVRIEAAFALAYTASEGTDWAGLLDLVKFYKSRRYDMDIGLPKPNDFHDFPEYFVLEEDVENSRPCSEMAEFFVPIGFPQAIPHAVARVRAADKKSPREAVEFVLQLLKYNDNNGNPYSDVFWLAALVQSVGELEFGQQSILFLSSLLKRIDRLLQFDRLMPSYNGILTISCIRTLTQIALKLSEFISLDHVFQLIQPFRNLKILWQVRIEASRALLDLEFYCRGMDAALLLFIKYVEEEPSLRGQLKLGVHASRLCQTRGVPKVNCDVESQTLVALLRLLESRTAFNNVYLRHHLFCILQILARRRPTLYGVPRDQTLQMNHAETCREFKNNLFAFLKQAMPPEPPEPPADTSNNSLVVPEASKAETVSNSQEPKKAVFKIRVKQSAASSRAETDHIAVEKSHCGPSETDRGASSSVSVDAPQRNFVEAMSNSNLILEEVNSCHNHGSRMSASIGSVKHVTDGDEIGKELQCTADSSVVAVLAPANDQASPSLIKDSNVEADAQKFASLQTLSAATSHDANGSSFMIMDSDSKKKGEKKKKDKDKKRKREDHKGRRDDPEYLERKRLKKEKKQKEKEMASLLSEAKPSAVDVPGKRDEPRIKITTLSKPSEPIGQKAIVTKTDQKTEASGGTTHKFRIKIKTRTLNNAQ